MFCKDLLSNEGKGLEMLKTAEHEDKMGQRCVFSFFSHLASEYPRTPTAHLYSN